MTQRAIREVPEMVGQGMNLFDNRDPEEKSVLAIKVVDITLYRQSDPENRALLKYATTIRGRLVQVHDCYPGESFGIATHVYYEEEGEERDKIIEHVSTWFDIQPKAMLYIIQQFAPEL